MVTHAEAIAPETVVTSSIAWVVLATQKYDLKTARRQLEMATQIDPDSPLLETFEKMLAEAEEFETTH